MPIHRKQLRELINITLEEVGFPSGIKATNLLLGTAAQESHCGDYILQIGGGPALGIFQMEPTTHNDIWKNYLEIKPTLARQILDHCNMMTPHVNALVYNLRYAICMARVHYLRIPHPLPDENNVKALAHYWKEYYNTQLGMGTEEEFIRNYGRYVI